MSITKEAVAFAESLTKDGKIKNDEDHWSQHNPDTVKENSYLKSHEI